VTLAASRDELERMLAAAAFNGYYGFRVGDFSPGQCTVEVPFRDEFERPGGVVSGPVFMAAADAALWLAVLTRRGVHETWVTADLTTAFLRPVRTDTLRHAVDHDHRAPR
jgi:acyl-coenzyme A thioesterase PaaI-like protein